ncbi:MAG: DUF5663 domain-containing protein [Candidatus Babeliales bacterium]
MPKKTTASQTAQPVQPLFLEAYVQKVLEDNGYLGLSQQTKDQFVPQFVAEAQYRLGRTIEPLLSEEAKKEFEDLNGQADVTEKEMYAFWKKYVPDFEEIVNKVLADYTIEMKKIFESIRTAKKQS